MAKTYVLNSISMNCGRRATWSDADWSGYIGNDAEGLRAGYYQNNYRATNILFDSTTLSSLRSKTVTSISLTVTVASGTLPVSTATGFPIGYKLNSTATTESNGAAWTRSNAASTAASTTVSVGYITSGNASTQSITSNTNKTYDLTGTSVPKYGYVIGTVQSNTGANIKFASGATLTVVTNETDYTLKLSYNANGGSGAPSAQSANVTTTGTPSYTFTIPNTTPTRSGFFFDGWKTTNGSTLYQPGGTITISANTTLYAQWSPASSIISSVTSSVPITGNSSTGKVTVSITRYNASYTHDVKIILGTRNYTLTGQGTTAEYTIPTTWLDQIPDASSRVATVEVTTKSGSTVIGVVASATFTATVPSDVKPTATLTSTDVNEDNETIDGWDVLVQGFSKIKLDVTAAAGNGATIKSIVFSGDNVSQSGLSTTTTSTILTVTGDRTWQVVVTDSRNRTVTKTLTRTVYPYAVPAIGGLKAMRCDSGGNEAPNDGTYASVYGVFSLSDIGGHNTFTDKKIYYKLHTASTWTQGVASATSEAWNTFGGGNISILYVYDIKVEVTDAVGYTTVAYADVNSVTGFAVGLKNDRARFGGPVQKAGLQVDWDTEFNGTINVTNRKAVAELSTSGWYRMLTYAIGTSGNVLGGHGTVFDINLERHTNSENHSIQLRMNSSSELVFCNETSKSKVQYIDKIRYTYNTTTYYGYIDIHVTNSCWVAADWVVHGFQSTRESVTSSGLVEVVDAPTGETIVLEYSFNKTGVAFGMPLVEASNDYGDLSRTGNSFYQTPSAVSVSNGTYTDVASVTLGVGTWVLLLSIRFEKNGTGYRYCRLSSTSGNSGSNFSMSANDMRPAFADEVTFTKSFDLVTNSAQRTLYLQAWQNSGSTLSCAGRLIAIQIC